MATPGGGDRLNLALGTHDARFAQHRQSLAREASGLAAHGPARRCVGRGKMWVAGLCVGMSASSRIGFHFILFVTGLLNETGHERVYPVDIARRTRFIKAAQALGLTPDEAREFLRTPVRCGPTRDPGPLSKPKTDTRNAIAVGLCSLSHTSRGRAVTRPRKWTRLELCRYSRAHSAMRRRRGCSAGSGPRNQPHPSNVHSDRPDESRHH